MGIKSVRLSFALTIAAVAFGVAFVLGTPLNMAFGPAMGGLVNAVLTAIIITIGCKGMEHFPYATIIWVAFSIPAIVTTTMGPPNIFKPVIALLTGLTMEILFILLGRKIWSYFVVGFVSSIVMTACILISMLVLGLNLDAAAKLMNRLWFILPVYGFLGGLGMFIGFRLFESSFKDVSFIKRIQRTDNGPNEQ